MKCLSFESGEAAQAFCNAEFVRLFRAKMDARCERCGRTDVLNCVTRQQVCYTTLVDAEINGEEYPIFNKRATDRRTVIIEGCTMKYADPFYDEAGEQWLVTAPDDAEERELTTVEYTFPQVEEE